MYPSVYLYFTLSLALFTPGGAIKTEAWILRRLVSIFSSVARRPHTPREKGLRDLYGAVGITLGSLEADENAEDPEGPSMCFSSVHTKFIRF